MNSVQPKSGPPGTVLRIKGLNLDAGRAAEVYLSDHKFDLKLKVLDQEANHMTVRISPYAKPGRHVFVVLTNEKEPRMVEQRVWVLVEPAAEPSTEGPQPE